MTMVSEEEEEQQQQVPVEMTIVVTLQMTAEALVGEAADIVKQVRGLLLKLYLESLFLPK